jgi:hypothetical protein
VFGEDPKIIPSNEGEPERSLVHRGRQAWYMRGVIRNVGEMETITYGDGSCVGKLLLSLVRVSNQYYHPDVDIHTGPFYLRAGLRSSGSSFRVCRSPNFVFGVATRATEGFKNGRIDGILGLGLK